MNANITVQNLSTDMSHCSSDQDRTDKPDKDTLRASTQLYSFLSERLGHLASGIRSCLEIVSRCILNLLGLNSEMYCASSSGDAYQFHHKNDSLLFAHFHKQARKSKSACECVDDVQCRHHRYKKSNAMESFPFRSVSTDDIYLNKGKLAEENHGSTDELLGESGNEADTSDSESSCCFNLNRIKRLVKHKAKENERYRLHKLRHPVKRINDSKCKTVNSIVSVDNDSQKTNVAIQDIDSKHEQCTAEDGDLGVELIQQSQKSIIRDKETKRFGKSKRYITVKERKEAYRKVATNTTNGANESTTRHKSTGKLSYGGSCPKLSVMAISNKFEDKKPSVDGNATVRDELTKQNIVHTSPGGSTSTENKTNETCRISSLNKSATEKSAAANNGDIQISIEKPKTCLTTLSHASEPKLLSNKPASKSLTANTESSIDRNQEPDSTRTKTDACLSKYDTTSISSKQATKDKIAINESTDQGILSNAVSCHKQTMQTNTSVRPINTKTFQFVNRPLEKWEESYLLRIFHSESELEKTKGQMNRLESAKRIFCITCQVLREKRSIKDANYTAKVHTCRLCIKIFVLQRNEDIETQIRSFKQMIESYEEMKRCAAKSKHDIKHFIYVAKRAEKSVDSDSLDSTIMHAQQRRKEPDILWFKEDDVPIMDILFHESEPCHLGAEISLKGVRDYLTRITKAGPGETKAFTDVVESFGDEISLKGVRDYFTRLMGDDKEENEMFTYVVESLSNHFMNLCQIIEENECDIQSTQHSVSSTKTAESMPATVQAENKAVIKTTGKTSSSKSDDVGKSLPKQLQSNKTNFQIIHYDTKPTPSNTETQEKSKETTNMTHEAMWSEIMHNMKAVTDYVAQAENNGELREIDEALAKLQKNDIQIRQRLIQSNSHAETEKRTEHRRQQKTNFARSQNDRPTTPSDIENGIVPVNDYPGESGVLATMTENKLTTDKPEEKCIMQQTAEQTASGKTECTYKDSDFRQICVDSVVDSDLENSKSVQDGVLREPKCKAHCMMNTSETNNTPEAVQGPAYVAGAGVEFTGNSLYVCLSVCLSCQSCLSVCPSVRPSVCLSVFSP